jgi:serine O-acetyltransferase
MIRSKDDYLKYLEADRMALSRPVRKFMNSVISIINPDYIWDFQRLLRRLEYLKNVKSSGLINKIVYLYLRLKFKKMSLRLGFSIPENVFGPGLAIVHYGTIVVNCNAKIGANCRIHVDTNIGASGGSDKAPQIGDNVYIAPGAKIFGDITIPKNTVIGANSVVNKSFNEENMLIAGVPAKLIKPIVIKRIIKHID